MKRLVLAQRVCSYDPLFRDLHQSLLVDTAWFSPAKQAQERMFHRENGHDTTTNARFPCVCI